MHILGAAIRDSVADIMRQAVIGQEFDIRHVAEIFERFRELCAERAMAVVVTLHDLNAAAHYADRVLLVKNGETVAWGTPEEVLTVGNLRDVYETPLYVGRNPATGAIAILPGDGTVT